MIKYCLKKWDENKGRLEAALREGTDFWDCKYEDLVRMVVREILNNGEKEYGYTWDWKHITQIDDGDYQGTLLFLIPRDTYQPAEDEYLMTYVGYGSCSGCDTLLGIQSYVEGKLNDDNVKDFMTLCRHIVANMIRPYNCGWREEPEFEPVEMEEDTP